MTGTTYIEKANRLDTLLKSQNIYDSMLQLMGIQVKNIRPKEEKERKSYDAMRLNELGEKRLLQVLTQEKKELIEILKSNNTVKHYALLKVGIDYGTNASTAKLDENLKKLEMPRPYATLIAQNKIKIPADKIRQLVY